MNADFPHKWNPRWLFSIIINNTLHLRKIIAHQSPHPSKQCVHTRSFKRDQDNVSINIDMIDNDPT